MICVSCRSFWKGTKKSLVSTAKRVILEQVWAVIFQPKVVTFLCSLNSCKINRVLLFSCFRLRQTIRCRRRNHRRRGCIPFTFSVLKISKYLISICFFYCHFHNPVTAEIMSEKCQFLTFFIFCQFCSVAYGWSAHTLRLCQCSVLGQEMYDIKNWRRNDLTTNAWNTFSRLHVKL